MNTELDHLVVVADTLEQGAAWCEATLGVVPGPGGQHPLMGTHNRLLAIGSAGFPKAYLEIIAINPDATAPSRARWFGMDDPALQAAAKVAPRLHHAVLRTTHIEMLRWGLVNIGIQPGEPIAAERPTPNGLLRWRILVRDDGAIACGGALPTLIEWQGVHPADGMAASPVQVTSLRLGGLAPRVAELLRLRGGAVEADGPALTATLATPRGEVILRSA